MSAAIRAFKAQFTRVEGGYLIYPSRKEGGKLVTDDEYDQLVAGWQRVAGCRGVWKLAGAICVALAIWTLVSDLFSFPGWINKTLVVLIVFALATRLFWASTTPHRLTKYRVAVTPPRTLAEAQREARAMVGWPIIIAATLGSGAAFAGSVTADSRTIGTWAWLVGSSGMLALYTWIACKKLMDHGR